MKRTRKWFVRMGLLLVVLAGIGALFLRHPGFLFAWSATLDGYSLHSDRPFEQAEALKVLKEVKARVDQSTLHDAGRKDAAFICNSRWRRLLFCIGNYKAGGLNYAPLTTNVFLSGGEVGENRLISPSGHKVPGEMTLAYFISHEITHSLTMEHLGFVAYWRLPKWMREGYADVVARGGVFKRPESRAAYLVDAKEMNWPVAAPYLRYNILFGYLLEQEECMTLDRVFHGRMPQAEVEKRLRRFLGAR